MSTYEEDLRKSLKDQLDAGALREISDTDNIFNALARAYPAKGTKIDWAHISGSIERTESATFLQCRKFLEFFDEMSSRFSLSGPVVYVGDNATDFALKGSVTDIRDALQELIEIPQHHYFIGPNFSWCMSMTIEGDMGFGTSVGLGRL